MIRLCIWHLKNFGCELIMGFKEPMSDPRQTNGICENCLELMDNDIGRYKKGTAAYYHEFHESKEELAMGDMDIDDRIEDKKEDEANDYD